MASSRWSTFWRRTGDAFQNQTRRIVRMEGADIPSRAPRTLYTFNTPRDAAEVVVGSDADIGGYSTVNFSLDTSSESESVGRPTGKFSGNLKLDVLPHLRGRIIAGYAGFKTPVRQTLFGKTTDNVYFHEYLALRVRAAGDPVLHKSFYVNVQTLDTMAQKTVWQQPLRFRRRDNDWETVYLPFSDFEAFTAGEPAEYDESIDKENILTVGISVLGGKEHIGGPYELGIDSVFVANREDIPPESLKPHDELAELDPYAEDPDPETLPTRSAT